MLTLYTMARTRRTPDARLRRTVGDRKIPGQWTTWPQNLRHKATLLFSGENFSQAWFTERAWISSAHLTDMRDNKAVSKDTILNPTCSSGSKYASKTHWEGLGMDSAIQKQCTHEAAEGCCQTTFPSKPKWHVEITARYPFMAENPFPLSPYPVRKPRSQPHWKEISCMFGQHFSNDELLLS